MDMGTPLSQLGVDVAAAVVTALPAIFGLLTWRRMGVGFAILTLWLTLPVKEATSRGHGAGLGSAGPLLRAR